MMNETERFFDRMEQAGITKVEFSENSPINRATLTRWLANPDMARPQMLVKANEHLDQMIVEKIEKLVKTIGPDLARDTVERLKGLLDAQPANTGE